MKFEKAAVKEAKAFVLGQLIKENPTWSYNRLNKSLKDEFGHGMRKQDMLKMVRGLRDIRPVRIEISEAPKATQEEKRIYMQWRAAGFLSHEAQALTFGKSFGHGTAADIYDSAPARAARATRREWLRKMVQKGWTKRERIDAILAVYRANDQLTPWDFIRKEYKPRMKKSMADYERAKRRRAENRIGYARKKAGVPVTMRR